MASEQTHRPVEQDSPEINPSLYVQLILDKGGRSIKWNKINFFNKWCWEIWTDTCKKKMKLDHQLTLYTKINSRWIKNFKKSCDTIKVLEENIGRKIWDIPSRNTFIVMSPQATDINKRMNKWDLIQLKSFSLGKEHSIKMKREPTLWENIFANDTSDKSLISKICKELTQLQSKNKKKTELKSGQKTLTDTSPRRTYRGPRDIWKDAQHH